MAEAAAAGSRWPLFALILLLLAATVGLAAASIVHRHQEGDLAARGSTATGVVVEARERIREANEIDLRWTDADGTVQTGTARTRRLVEPGTEVEVRYDPRQPSSVQLAGRDAGNRARSLATGEAIAAVIAGACLLGAIAVAMATSRG